MASRQYNGLMVLALVLGWVGFAAAEPKVETGDVDVSGTTVEAVDAARAALEGGRWDEAAAAWGAIADVGGGPSARLAQAVALYEAGAMAPARTAAEKALATRPKDVVGLNILALAMIDGGAVESGIARLEEARTLATGPWKARILVNLALAHYDRGDAAKALACLDEAVGSSGGDAQIDAQIASARTTVAGLSGKDAGVGPLLGRGDVRGARVKAEAAAAGAATRRDSVTAAIQLAAVERAEGALDGAAKRLESAAKSARESGMVREHAIALGNLGLVHSIAGRLPLAADALRAAVSSARSGGYRVVEVDLRCELGLALVRMGDVDAAEGEQRAAGALLASMDYPQGVARQAELGGAVAAARGDLGTAESALGRAASFHESAGRYLDAARSATALAAAFQGKEEAKAKSWAGRAEGLFAKAGDPIGPAHVALALALADARAKRHDAALAGFARAAELAEAVGSARGKVVARISRENAAEMLVRLGQSADVAKMAAQAGVGDLVARQQQLATAFTDYDAGLKAYNAADWPTARDRFARARAAFEKLAEPGYAGRARKAAAWAAYNQLVALPAQQSYPSWQQLVDETAKLDDAELFLRTYAAAALSAHTVGKDDPSARLKECGRLAERQGVREVAARCYGALAERAGPLPERARLAKTAFAFDPQERAAVYALYAVAVDAYNAGEGAIAIELCTLARPQAGSLVGAIDEVLAAARQGG